MVGYKRVKGILISGAPGTGKTILAVQIAKIMNSRKPKLLTVCDISERYLGKSHASIREIFFEAKEEEKLVIFKENCYHYLLLLLFNFFIILVWTRQRFTRYHH